MEIKEEEDNGKGKIKENIEGNTTGIRLNG